MLTFWVADILSLVTIVLVLASIAYLARTGKDQPSPTTTAYPPQPAPGGSI